jgi:hypothetical protein
MQRDMSSPMDASLSTRNQGQLISTEMMVTQARRVGNMREVNIDAAGPRPIPTSRARAVQVRPPLALPAGPGFGISRAQGLQDITVTGLGTTNLKWIGVSMLAGIILWKLTAGRRAKTQAALQKASQALKEV